MNILMILAAGVAYYDLNNRLSKSETTDADNDQYDQARDSLYEDYSFDPVEAQKILAKGRKSAGLNLAMISHKFWDETELIYNTPMNNSHWFPARYISWNRELYDLQLRSGWLMRVYSYMSGSLPTFSGRKDMVGDTMTFNAPFSIMTTRASTARVAAYELKVTYKSNCAFKIIHDFLPIEFIGNETLIKAHLGITSPDRIGPAIVVASGTTTVMDAAVPGAVGDVYVAHDAGGSVLGNAIRNPDNVTQLINWSCDVSKIDSISTGVGRLSIEHDYPAHSGQTLAVPGVEVGAAPQLATLDDDATVLIRTRFIPDPAAATPLIEASEIYFKKLTL